MFGLSPSHLIIVFVVVLLFGAKRLPDLGNSLGKGLKSFKDGLNGLGTDASPTAIANTDRKQIAENSDDSTKA